GFYRLFSSFIGFFLGFSRLFTSFEADDITGRVLSGSGGLTMAGRGPASTKRAMRKSHGTAGDPPRFRPTFTYIRLHRRTGRHALGAGLRSAPTSATSAL